MHKYYDGQMIIKWATATAVTKLECKSRDIQKFSNCISLKNTPGQVGGVFEVVMYILTSLGGPNEFIFFCYGISNKAWVYFFMIWFQYSILLCVPTVSVHSDKLIGCGSFYTRAFISLRHMGSAGQAVPFTNPPKCIVMLQPKMEPKAAFKMESLKTKHSLEKEHTVFHSM